ncbi:hypothetical protein E2C01_088932 [Portunus trituberculatus]|uniref:Uncharacterized protein n=1 Tax=Portunus trituberculatus TaxID=210409 RepID=A0A5B7J7I0_PORTR|nr:hypothetical protein [Portunus trituberculatus]
MKLTRPSYFKARELVLENGGLDFAHNIQFGSYITETCQRRLLPRTLSLTHPSTLPPTLSRPLPSLDPHSPPPDSPKT